MKKSNFYTWSKNGMKMIINSDFKEFNKQTNCITSGNVIANTLYGNYIRTWNTTECNGLTFPEGHLFEYDLKFFNISSEIKNYIKSLNKMVCLYEVFIYRNGKKDILGWLIEDEGEIIYTRVNHEIKTNYNKRYSAIDTVKKILENE